MYTKVAEICRNKKLFPNLVTLGAYDPYSQVVCLNYYDRDKLRALDRNNLHRYRDYLKLAIHELNHFYDHTSTLWGQRNLVLIHNAISAFLKNDPEQFWRINELKRASMRIFYPSYFSLIHPSAPTVWDGINWKYQFTVGLEFDHLGKLNQKRPIIFTRFSTSNDIPIARVPISIVSLLETSSVCAEIVSEMGIIHSLDEPAEAIEIKLLEKDLKEQLYNPNLTVYSVASHCLANSINIKDIVQAYQLSSALSRFCLNLPLEFYETIKIPEELYLWGDKNINFLNCHNIGFLYLLMTKSAIKFNEGDRVEDWLSETIKKAGLPSIEKINDRVIELMNGSKKELVDSSIRNRYEYLLDIGLQNFKFNSLYKSISLIEIVNGDIVIPPLLLGDDGIFPLPGKSLDMNIYDIEKSIQYS